MYMEKAFLEDYFKNLGDAVNRLNEVFNHIKSYANVLTKTYEKLKKRF
jgi:hypothetical protein